MIHSSALARNPALLELDLYGKGARLDDSCSIEGDGGRKVLRTRAGLASGLELIQSLKLKGMAEVFGLPAPQTAAGGRRLKARSR